MTPDPGNLRPQALRKAVEWWSTRLQPDRVDAYCSYQDVADDLSRLEAGSS